MKKLLTLLVLISAINANSQRGIATSESGAKTTLDASAIIDAEATTKGILIPRILLSATNVAAPVVTPANSLLVYNTATAGVGATAVSPGYYYWDTPSTQWVRLMANSDSVVTIDSAEWVEGSTVGLTSGSIYARRALERGDTIVIDTAGKMGIGINKPNQNLEVSNKGTVVAHIVTTDSTISDRAVFGLKRGNKLWDLGINTQLNNSKNLNFREGANPVVTFKEGGNVGIGITDPIAKLHIPKGDTIFGQMLVGDAVEAGFITFRRGNGIIYPNFANGSIGFNNSGNNYKDSRFRVANFSGSGNMDFISGQVGATPSGFHFVSSNGSAFVDTNMVVTGNGLVGIGTTNPNAKLHVKSPNNNIAILQNSIYRKENAALQCYIELRDSLNDAFGFIGEGSSGKIITTAGYYDHGVSMASFQSNTAVSNRAEIGVNKTQNANITFDTKLAERMRIDSNGNVGIGTTNPSELLELQGGGIQLNGNFGIGFRGETPFQDTAHLDANRIYFDPAFFGATSHALILETSDFNQATPDGGIAFTNIGNDDIRDTAMVIRGNGLVGIGTPNPQRTLDVRGSLRIERTGTPHIELVQTGAPVNQTRWRAFAQNDGNFAIIPYTDGGANIGNGLQIDHTGNVGVGAIAPQYKIHVLDNVNTQIGQFIQNGNSTGNLVSEILLVGQGSGKYGYLAYHNDGYSNPSYPNLLPNTTLLHAEQNLVLDAGSTRDIIFGTSIMNSQNMIIKGATGDVGIGTPTPSSRLDVQVPILGQGVIEVTTPNTSMIIYEDADLLNFTNFRTTAGKGYVIASSADRPDLVVRDTLGGYVGIGTLAPTQKLHVEGNVKATGAFISGTTTYPDYVFESYYTGESALNKNYTFQTLKEIENYINENKHLPGVKSIQEVTKEDGTIEVNMTETSIISLEKIEELYLHVIQINKEKEVLRSEVDALKDENKQLREDFQNQLDVLKQRMDNK